MLFGTKRERELFKKELALEREKMLLEVDRKVADAYKRGETQRFDYECSWHSEKEEKVVEIATLQGKIDALKTLNEDRTNLLNEKTAKITYLENVVSQLIEKVGQQPTVNVLPVSQCGDKK